jgi:hypothetical protein
MDINYYDGPFTCLAGPGIPYIFYQDQYETIPSNCDNIGITFWTGDFDEHIQLVNSLLPKTKQLLIFAPEPVTTDKFINFVNIVKSEPRIKLFGNAILNFDTPSNYIAVPNWFIICTNYYVTSNWAIKLLNALDFTCAKSKKFDCLLGKEKWHRTFISNQYKNSAHRDDIIFTYFKNDISTGLWNFDLQDNSSTASQIHFGNELGRISAVLPVEIYNNSYYSIIAETTVSNEHSHFTEKTAKPIVAKRLFVMFAGQYFLRNLRKLGFQTFGNVIDESYDEIADATERFTAAWAQVERLCQLDTVSILSKIEPILQHNQQHFLNTDWYASLKKIINGGAG